MLVSEFFNEILKLLTDFPAYFSFQVNAGPLAYAKAFLEEERQFEFPANKVKELKRIYV